MATLAKRLDALTNVDLAAVFNKINAARQVTKFSDHSTAVKRTQLALEARDFDFSFASGELVVGPAATTAPRPRTEDGRTITLLTERNPKAAGSKSETRFALYRTGMTVGDYVAEVRKLGDKRRKAIRDIAFDTEHGYIRVG
jgi:hypothetical protein